MRGKFEYLELIAYNLCRMRVRQFDFDKDYETVCDWWRGWRWEPIIPELLSDMGVMIEDDEPLCAAWIFTTNSPLAYVDWYISNPKVRREGMVEFLLKVTEDMCRAMGYQFIFSSVRNQHLIKKMKDNGFYVGDRNMTNLIKGL